MGRRANHSIGKLTPAAPTAPRPRDAAGRELDQWGLPLSGPARAARLRALERADPNIDPTGWTDRAEVTPPVATIAAPPATTTETETQDG